MTIAYLHLVRLTPSSPSPPAFLTLIHQHAASYHYVPLTTSQCRHWVARPSLTHPSSLNQPWDVLVVLQPRSDSPQDAASGQIPSSLSWAVAERYTLKLAIPGKLLKDWTGREGANERVRKVRMPQFNTQRLAELKGKIVKSSSQKLEASPELLDFATRLMGPEYGDRPVTMLNLLRFNEGEPGRESYKQYGKRFGTDVGAKRGGNAKIVGRVIGRQAGDGKMMGEGGKGGWDEVAIVHYPNIVAFCDMAAGEDYQEANARYRLPALRDTLLLCTTEVLPEDGAAAASKL